MDKATIGDACDRARPVLVQFFGKEKADKICASIRGEESALLGQKTQMVEPPMSIRMAAKLTGLTPGCLYYHANKGRIRRAHIPGSTRSLGYVAEDIRAIVQGRAS